MDDNTKTIIESAVLRRLIEHLQKHSEVQNIELMVLADFCRNCLAKWYAAAAGEQGHPVSYTEAQEVIYGMPYVEWKTRFQKEATPEQLAAYAAREAAKKQVVSGDESTA